MHMHIYTNYDAKNHFKKEDANNANKINNVDKNNKKPN